MCVCVCVRNALDGQASDGGSTTASTSGAVVPRKSLDTFPTSGVPPLSNGQLGLGGSLSPVPCPPSNSAPAQATLPPPSLPPPYPTAPLQVRVASALHNFARTKEKKKSGILLSAFLCLVDYSLSCPPSLRRRRRPRHHAVTMVRFIAQESFMIHWRTPRGPPFILVIFIGSHPKTFVQFVIAISERQPYNIKSCYFHTINLKHHRSR